MTAADVEILFVDSTTRRDYLNALTAARKLKGKEQLLVLDALFDAADRLKLQRSTGQPVGMKQEISGDVLVTWETHCRRPDGSRFKMVESATLEPTDYGSGWRSRTKDVPEVVVEAVTAAAMADELKAARKRRILVR